MLRADIACNKRRCVLYFQERGKKKRKNNLAALSPDISCKWIFCMCWTYHLGIPGKPFHPWAEDALKEQWWNGAEILSSLCSWGVSLWVKDEDDLLRHSMEACAATACATLVFWGKQETSDLSNVNSELLTRAKFCLKGKEQQEWSVFSYLISCLTSSSHERARRPKGELWLSCITSIMGF